MSIGNSVDPDQTAPEDTVFGYAPVICNFATFFLVTSSCRMIEVEDL